MPLRRRNLSHKLSSEPSTIRLFSGDFSAVQSLVKECNSDESSVICHLIHEALEAKTKITSSNNEADEKSRELQRQVFLEELASVKQLINEQSQLMRIQAGILEQILLRSGESVGMSLENLKLTEGIFAMVKEDLTIPTLIKNGAPINELDGFFKEVLERV